MATKEPIITLSAGPVAAYPGVMRALSRPIEYDYDRHFLELYEAVNRKVTQALRSATPALILHCEPAPGLEAAAASLIGPDDVVLNLASGVYGKGFGYWSARYNKELLEIEVPYNEAIDPASVEAAFRKRPDIKIVSVVHHDTPSGTINPVKEIGQIVRKHNALMLVDAVSSWAGMDIHPEESCSDVFVTGPGKCLGGAPGLTIMAVSDRAWKHMEANPKAPRASILSLLDWKEAWRHDKPFPFTPSVAEVNGLDGAIDLYLAEGPEAVWKRHALTAQACRAGIKAMGLSLWAAREEIASPTCTAVRVPDGIKDSDILAASRALYGVVFSSGRGETQGKLIRIGHMGPVAEPIYAVVAVTALGGALRKLGRKTDVGAGVAAATAVIDQARA
ncbi:MAG TPA: alanine--glyoxylate aminotransferase family protein [Hypericibacter adhaerens]|jgi:pyridoxamine--pyruvate transaminase|uniref:Aminotransferase n=1 Tax=Hypericibacter adhaerens TaxID=2602016 RepID=A0A5J6N1P3_9PROT|nr:alanine--glyoxylate aminotransferase family protein [Hypericibacter adhaerens]QEX23922.1 aminotransferase [Hypericibacter adhaerens]HWA44550.1 alanine--glyoxylate aminotransferase family protein [Hypericibacter adhaerens]